MTRAYLRIMPNGNAVYPTTLKLGQDYMVNNRHCRLIQVTPKGFNFLCLSTSRCLLKKHLYDKRFYNKLLPSCHLEIRTWVPHWLWIQEIREAKIA